VARIGRGLDRADQAPTPAELHGADADQVHARLVDRAVGLLDQQAFDAAPAEIAGEREADRASADDEDGCGGFVRHSHPIASLRAKRSNLRHKGPEIASARFARLAMTRYFGRFISLDELTTACRLRASPTALGTSMVMAWRRYSFTPSVATAGA